ncbi:LacI family DNA-binding transcriptional regulator [Paenarthrobacter sp. Z7-10]|uniref:LacI family DNA-binding transcriptional regulator n=1 Tax=Paenarthrobacter sp. Z7-10 TaxID=2787635 RepID=UPI0022A964E8|nr:LacI family DNA-binding transcriptional regulator [Paenarthrobacter sp. Z7-10]MCZ2402851.1 LacI family DNA-binding transcriptional regulator [Paenarthrobacter sp. Z7-10]
MNRVTIAGLAEQLGISKASVSYALNDQRGVSAETRQRVLALAQELGWYPSSSARALSHARTGAIGIVLSREPEMIGAEPYYMSLLAGIESVLGATDMSLLLRMVGTEGQRDLAVYERWAGERRVDGVILFDHLIGDPRLALLDRLALPYVLHGASVELPGATCTTVDQDEDAATLVTHLHELGHHRLAHVTGPRTLIHEKARLAAVLRHAGRHGMDVTDIESDYTLAGGAAATSALLAGASMPTAVIYGNDLMTMGGMTAFKLARVPVPDAVSVVSWDDSILCQLGSPAVTALQRNPQEQGRRSARLLLEVIAGRQPANVRAGAGVLVVRESSARKVNGAD